MDSVGRLMSGSVPDPAARSAHQQRAMVDELPSTPPSASVGGPAGSVRQSAAPRDDRAAALDEQIQNATGERSNKVEDREALDRQIAELTQRIALLRQQRQHQASPD